MRTIIQKWIGLLLLILILSVACQGIADKGTVKVMDSLALNSQKSAKQIPDTLPAPDNPYVNDFEFVFTKPQVDSLILKMSALRQSDSIVFCVVTLDSSLVKPDQFDEFTLKLANYWGVGDRDKDNGIVIFFSKGYRRLRIQNGRGIEKIISDAQTDSVMQSVIFPKFKAGDYYSGVSQGIDALTELVRIKKVHPAKSKTSAQ